MTDSTEQDSYTADSTQTEIAIQCSDGFWEWLERLNISLSFTTYQSNRLFLIGRKDEGRIAVNQRLFDKPMGICFHDESLVMACRYQIWKLENRLAPSENHQGCDRLFFPSVAYTTGDLNAHDVAVGSDGRIYFINTDFSCLATLQPGFSFSPVWQPKFIGKLVAEDRCHLNGLALQGGIPAFATACSTTDIAAGWRSHRIDGGVVIHIPSNEIVGSGLSMPHSPRWYRDRLWLLNSGAGEFGFLRDGRFESVVFCPGFVRGLAFVEHYAVVGLSKLRSASFTGLDLQKRLAADGIQAQCGLLVIDLESGQIVHKLDIDGVVEELFDVVVLPDVRQPRAIGLRNDDIGRLVNFPGSNGIVITKPTLSNTAHGMAMPVAGLPEPSTVIPKSVGEIKYQRIYHLNPDNLLPYDIMTQPRLSQRWQTEPQRGELFGVSASDSGNMIGLAIAEMYKQSGEEKAELISLYVVPDSRHQGVETNLIRHLRKLVNTELDCRLHISNS